MHRYLCLFLLCLIVVSCERKSGRKSRVERQSNSAQVTRVINTNRSLDKKHNTTVGRNNKILTGAEIFEAYNSAVFVVFTSDGINEFQGSGFFISDKGFAVSNYHVFKGSTKGLECIKLMDGSVLKIAEVIGYDESQDYIIFKVAVGARRVTYIPISNSHPKVGEKAYAIGSPLGLENTFSSGEISQIRNDCVLQISVPIDHGSSGGALINKYGEAIGITTAGLDESGANLNFAMSISVLDRYSESIQ